MPLVIKARKVDPVLRGVASKFTKYEQQIYDIYIKAFSQMPNDLNNPAVIEMIRAAIASSNPSGGAISLQWSEFISALDKSIPTLASQLAASANISASALPKSIQISSSFTATDPRAIAWAQQRAGARILGITKESQKAVAETIARGLQGKLNRDEVIDGVTRVVGLDSRQARALGTFYEKNLNSLLDQGLSYENAARAAKRLGERYRDRLIRQRATRIARTETNAAANAGRLLSWSEADIQGLLPTGSEKRWKTSQDERNCPTCRPMHNETVPWQGTFSTGDVMPPVHVNCLCTAVIVPAEAEFEKSLYSPIQKTRKTAWLFAKHGSHNQKTHGKKGGGAPSSVGNFTLDENPEYAKQNLTVYTHPNGTRVIFQDLDKIENKDPMVKETLEIVDGLSETHPIPNATFVVESENGIVQRGMDGATYTPGDGTATGEAIDAYIRSKGLPAPKDISAPYISIKQRVVAPSIRPKTFPVSGGGTAIRNKTTPEEDRAVLRQLITHEWGHALDTRPEALSKSMFAGRGANTTSTYGAKNGREFFAETFAASILGGLSQDSPDSKPDYKAAAEYLGIDSLKKSVYKEFFGGFIAYDNFETGESLVIEGRMPSDYYEGFAKHGTHDQKTHAGRSGGGGGSSVGEVVPPTKEGRTEYGMRERMMEDSFESDEARERFMVASQEWQGEGYRRVQGSLSSGERPSPEAKAVIDEFDAAMIPFDDDSVGYVYRGQTEGLDNLAVGDSFTSPLFQAATTDPITAASFSKASGGVLGGIREGEPVTILRIDPMGARGVVILDSSEFEVVLDRGTQFTVEDITEEVIDGVPMRIIDVSTG